MDRENVNAARPVREADHKGGLLEALRHDGPAAPPRWKVHRVINTAGQEMIGAIRKLLEALNSLMSVDGYRWRLVYETDEQRERRIAARYAYSNEHDWDDIQFIEL